MHIALFNPWIASSNSGDQIIYEAVFKIISTILPEAHIINFQTQDIVSNYSIRLANDCHLRIVGGTNLLSSNMLKYKQWKINVIQSLLLKPVILMGVGWWQYQSNPDFYTKTILKNILSKDFLHSVRDNYTAEKLRSIGFSNVVNTGCPTMWGLTSKHCESIPVSKSNKAIVTITDYKPNYQLDREFLLCIVNNYQEVFLWPQGMNDVHYFHSLGIDGITILPHSIKYFDDHFSDINKPDFIGTRLHAGIRALQHQARALIIAVDNRAIEISKDTGLHVVNRGNNEAVEAWIKSPVPTRIVLNLNEINKWKSQFLVF